jgi:D-serine deaminase-like pyridoxal phosphate-dependent protein
MSEWYHISNISELDSPALVIYKDRVEKNIATLAGSIDRVDRLRPHVKTHKSPQVTQMMLQHGIEKFKCATIAEAEMLATAGARDILIAYQPVGPKGRRFLDLVLKFPHAGFACLVDNTYTAEELGGIFASENKKATVYIDLNVGMDRTGIAPENAWALVDKILSMTGVTLKGLHAYDGHIRDTDFNLRKTRSDEAFEKVIGLRNKIKKEAGVDVAIVAGGTPTYSVHCLRKDVECSPGTFIYWDKGYETILPEQHYLHAAVVISRIISKPAPGILCADLGHKSIASENPLNQRVFFINAPELQPVGHSEEHMVLRSDRADQYHVGDILYGIPYHVCPTIALYERSAVMSQGRISEWWLTESRNKKITV